MPYKWQYDKKYIPAELDKRRKIPETEHERIKTLYFKEKLSLRAIARLYAVNHRLIHFIIHPEKAKKNAEQFKERRKDGRYYPEKAKWAEQMRKHRHYKQSIKNELKPNAKK